MTTMERAQVLALMHNPTLTDEEIVVRVGGGEIALFEVLMRRHNRRVYRALRAILKNEADVEDAMQQTYVAAFSHLATFRSEAKFSTWLIRIAVNEGLGQVRRNKVRLAADDTIETSEVVNTSPDPEHRAAGAEMLSMIETCVENLPDRYRMVFMLREVEGLDTEETATVLDVTSDVIKQRLHRARAMIRKELLERVGRVAPDTFRFDDRRCDRIVAAVFVRIRN